MISKKRLALSLCALTLLSVFGVDAAMAAGALSDAQVTQLTGEISAVKTDAITVGVAVLGVFATVFGIKAIRRAM